MNNWNYSKLTLSTFEKDPRLRRKMWDLSHAYGSWKLTYVGTGTVFGSGEVRSVGMYLCESDCSSDSWVWRGKLSNGQPFKIILIASHGRGSKELFRGAFFYGPDYDLFCKICVKIP